MHTCIFIFIFTSHTSIDVVFKPLLCSFFRWCKSMKSSPSKLLLTVCNLMINLNYTRTMKGIHLMCAIEVLILKLVCPWLIWKNWKYKTPIYGYMQHDVDIKKMEAMLFILFLFQIRMEMALHVVFAWLCYQLINQDNNWLILLQNLCHRLYKLKLQGRFVKAVLK